ncbi:MAG TPA: ABC transporter permease [Bacteroidales bacterium]|nr:ABC transporter permease [Bacteroidales bacterium]
MKNILIIAKKEITDLLRDKRTLMTMVIIPLLVFPIIMGITGKITSNNIKKEQEKALKIGIVESASTNPIKQLFESHKDIQFIHFADATQFEALIQKDSIDGALVVSDSLVESISSMNKAQITLLYKSANWGVKERTMSVLEGYKNALMDERLAKLNIARQTIDPIEIRVQDISSVREKIGQSIGGMIPYIFIIFSFIGCMYPAIDLFTNEKERGTLETILVTPVKRLEILFGKMIVVSLTGLISAVLSIFGLSVGLKQFSSDLPNDIMGTLTSFIEPSNAIMLIAMMVPLIVFFAGLLTMVTTYAKSYKEAQSIISPMMIIVILPAVIGMMPGIELNFSTALIPIANISLATKEIIAGTINYSLFVVVLCSLLVYAAIGVFAAAIWFGRESNIVKA